MHHAGRPVGPFRSRFQLGQKEHVDLRVRNLIIIVDMREAFPDRIKKRNELINQVGFGRVQVEELIDMVNHSEISLPGVHGGVYTFAYSV